MEKLIFVSYGSLDREVTLRLVECLHKAGLGAWIDVHEMKGGEDHADAIMDAITQAQLAVVCLSDRSVNSRWVQKEIDWCQMARRTRQSLRCLIPIQVGPLNLASAPEYIQEIHRSIHITDLWDPSRHQSELVRLIQHMRKSLGLPTLVELAGVISAMTSDEYEWLCRNPPNTKQWNALRNLCLRAGMPGEPDPLLTLNSRYGKRIDDFSPFAYPESTGLETLKGVLDKVISTGEMPRQLRTDVWEHSDRIWVYWYHDDLSNENEQTENFAWQRLRADASIVIVDSLSVFHPRVSNMLRKLPPPASADQRSLLWIPPYSRYTSTLVKLTNEAVNEQVHLDVAFREWGTVGRYSAFDIGTLNGLLAQLYQLIFHCLPAVNRPRQEHRMAMQIYSDGAVPFPGAWFEGANDASRGRQ